MLPRKLTLQKPALAETVSGFIPSSNNKLSSRFKLHDDYKNRETPFNIVFYSHDTMGMGHMRRNLIIAKSFLQSQLPVNILMIAGTSSATAFSMPQGMDRVILPSICKGDDGGYKARSINMSCEKIIHLRATIIKSVVKGFDPHVFIADGVPRGAGGELDPTLNFLHSTGRTRCILGLRDILDDPKVVHDEWARRGNEEYIQHYYDSVWIYGDPMFYDSVEEYNIFKGLNNKVKFTGYLDRSNGGSDQTDEPYQSLLADLNLPPGKLVLCMSGGGEDGAKLLEAFSKSKLPPDTNGIMIRGPLMPENIKNIIDLNLKNNPRIRMLKFHPEPTKLIKMAERIIAMGGYNTVSEILSFGKPLLIVPRVFPRTEQLIRAIRIKEHGLGDYCHPEQLTPDRITRWLGEKIQPSATNFERIDFNGLSRLPLLLEDELKLGQALHFDREGGGNGSNGQ